jgi:hypothetical protein
MSGLQLPETDLARIERYCRDRVPDDALHQVRCEWHRRGRSVTVCETRAPWDGQGEWTHLPIAKLRYRPGSNDWSLHWADRNGRWHAYDPTGTHLTGPVQRLLDEIDQDPTHIFWG